MWTKGLVVLAVMLAVTIGSFRSYAEADQPRIDFPENYRAELVNYLSLDRTQNSDQIIRLFAPKSALEATQAGKSLPNGTVLVAEVYKAKKDADGEVIESSLGRRIRGKFAAVAVMQKENGWGDKFPDDLKNGDWDFAIFKPTGERLVKKDLNKCRACHAPLKGTQHLFSLEHIVN